MIVLTNLLQLGSISATKCYSGKTVSSGKQGESPLKRMRTSMKITRIRFKKRLKELTVSQR